MQPADKILRSGMAELKHKIRIQRALVAEYGKVGAKTKARAARAKLMLLLHELDLLKLAAAKSHTSDVAA